MDLDRVLRSTRVAAFATDASCRIVACNDAAVSLFGLTSADIMNRPCYDLLDGHALSGVRFCSRGCPVRSAAGAGRPIAPLNLRIRRGPRGSDLAEISSMVLPGGNGDAPILVHLLRSDGAGLAPDPIEGPRTGADRLLTSRETEVLREIAAGLSVKQLAAELMVSLSTARAHVRNILRKFGVHRQIDAVLAGQRRGLL